MKNDHILSEYEERYPTLVGIANSLEKYIAVHLEGAERIDRISARAKSPDRYISKAEKLDQDGSMKYKNPNDEIQDQIGARITVFYLKDIGIIKKSIEKYFRFIEKQNKIPSSDSEFGYFGLHYILKLPDDVVPDGIDVKIPDFFELQIKTLFQHAWSEAHHDLGYKSLKSITGDERRKIAFTAAQAWGADTIFDELASALVYNDNEAENQAATSSSKEHE